MAEKTRNMFQLRDLVVTEAAMALIGAVILVVRHAPMPLLAAPGQAPAMIAVGLSVGAATAAATVAGIRSTSLAAPVAAGLDVFREIRLSVPACALIGLVAGLGEETLFRAALLPWLGIWIASALFMLAHAGTARLGEGVTPGRLLYLAIALVIGLLLGLAFQRYGLAVTVSAHAAFDAVMLLGLRPLIGTVPPAQTA